MNNKTVLIIEDKEAQRLALKESLELREFSVEDAGDVATARDLISKLGEKIAVMVLDMQLEDPAHPEVTGAHLGIEAMKAMKKLHAQPPEFLINTAYSEVIYYELALELGVAAYLHKNTSQNRVIQHIRGLALRRALSVENPEMAVKIRSIAESSRSQLEAVKQFCSEILIPEFKSCMGTPFILLLRDKERQKTISCGGSAELPAGEDPAYDTIQAFAYAGCAGTEPFVFDSAKVRLPDNVGGNSIIDALNGAAFISLSIGRDFPLTLGILKAESRDFQLAEPPLEMAQVLVNYFNPAVLEQLLKLSSYWAENNAKRTVRLSETSKICLYIGQEQISIMQDAVDSGAWSSDSVYFQDLHNLAVDLRETGHVLSSVRGTNPEGNGNADPLQDQGPIQAADFIRSIWKELDDSTTSGALQIMGDCEIAAAGDDLFIIVSRILQWFTQRFVEYPSGTKPEIAVQCKTSEEGPIVIIEDRSRRLGEQIRKRLFDPFTQAVPLPSIKSAGNYPGLYLPLYLAKALVEEKYQGEIEECSNELADKIGHRFVIKFRSPQAATQSDR